MTTRAQYYRNTTKHAQRGIAEKPVSKPMGTDTTWISEFVSSIQGLVGQFNSDSMIALQLGDREQRVVRLRKLSAMGILRMSSHFKNGHFVEFRWELDAGQL